MKISQPVNLYVSGRDTPVKAANVNNVDDFMYIAKSSSENGPVFSDNGRNLASGPESKAIAAQSETNLHGKIKLTISKEVLSSLFYTLIKSYKKITSYL